VGRTARGSAGTFPPDEVKMTAQRRCSSVRLGSRAFTFARYAIRRQYGGRATRRRRSSEGT
jgi:hypothetical protein